MMMKENLQIFPKKNEYLANKLFLALNTGRTKITLVLLKSKYFQGIFDFLQKKIAIRTVKGLKITCA